MFNGIYVFGKKSFICEKINKIETPFGAMNQHSFLHPTITIDIVDAVDF